MTNPALSPSKRKRSDARDANRPPSLYTDSSFELSDAPSVSANSPRTKVAYKLFRGLSLNDHDGGVGHDAGAARDITTPPPPSVIAAGSLSEADLDGPETPRKRARVSGTLAEPVGTAEAAAPHALTTPASRSEQASSPAASSVRSIEDIQAEDDANPLPTDKVQQLMNLPPPPSPSRAPKKAPVPVDRTIEAIRARSRMRNGTPPITFGNNSITHDSDEVNLPTTRFRDVVDPVRAALTWHEDEITVYDPDDEEDDGVGINGIGFKPTPAVAYARTLKRKQQLSDYRKREEREARAKRSQRRRASPAKSLTRVQRSDSILRRVHFVEVEATPPLIAT